MVERFLKLMIVIICFIIGLKQPTTAQSHQECMAS